MSLSDIPVKEFFNSAESSSPKSTTNQDNAHQTPTNNKTVTVSTVKDFAGKVQYTKINKLPDISCLHSQTHKERRKPNLTTSNALFATVAWTVEPAFQLFKLCLEVVWVDVTSHSNNKGFHLLTFMSRLSIGKQLYGYGSSYQISRDSAFDEFSKRPSPPLSQSGYMIV